MTRGTLAEEDSGAIHKDQVWKWRNKFAGRGGGLPRRQTGLEPLSRWDGDIRDLKVDGVLEGTIPRGIYEVTQRDDQPNN